MLAFLPAIAFAVLAPLVSGTIEITSPTGAGWIGNATVQVSWTWNNSDTTSFTIEMGNPTISYGLLAQGPIAILSNVQTEDNSVAVALPSLPAGNDYYIAFVGVSDVNTVYARSPSFPLRANPTSSSVPTSSVGASTRPPNNGTKTTALAKTSTGINGNITGTTTSTDTGTITTPTSSFTSLVISTLTTTTSTTKKGDATRMEAAWYIGVVGAFLGAIFA